MHPEPLQDLWRMIRKRGFAAAQTSLKMQVRDMIPLRRITETLTYL